jgi:signal transduction histidine kinase
MPSQEWPFPVLLVDDEQDVRDVLSIALADAGYEVLTAENGLAALDIYRKSRPPIVITDIKMPVMDGIELLRRIKGDHAETEVIMITGHGDMDLAISSLKHQAGDFITKPINVDALEIALKRTRERIVMRQKLHEYTTSLEALVQEKSQLQDHLSSLGLMIGSISHSIKGLLTGLDGGIYLLGKGLKARDEAQVEEGWKTVQLMADRIRNLVMDILFYAKKRDLQWEKVDLYHFAEETARIMESRLKDTGISFRRDFSGAIADCEIDPSYVHAALMNLFDNAIDACQRKDNPSDSRITFLVAPNNSKITFSVIDNGIGMDQETQGKLFTLFFSSKGIKGTGLGLYITKNIIEQHGGSIAVTSKPGEGSCFTIILPKQGKPNATDDAQAHDGTQRTGPAQSAGPEPAPGRRVSKGKVREKT